MFHLDKFHLSVFVKGPIITYRDGGATKREKEGGGSSTPTKSGGQKTFSRAEEGEGTTSFEVVLT